MKGICAVHAYNVDMAVWIEVPIVAHVESYYSLLTLALYQIARPSLRPGGTHATPFVPEAHEGFVARAAARLNQATPSLAAVQQLNTDPETSHHVCTTSYSVRHC